jgi:glycosyltransferase involved in cell wall biosynthesis
MEPLQTHPGHDMATPSASITADFLLLSAYPLSREYLEVVREKIGGDFDQITLAQLRENGGIELFRAVRRVRPAMLLLPLEDENSVALLPILKFLAAFTGARNIAVVQPGLELRPVSRLSVAADSLRFGFASIRCAVSAGLSWIDLKRLLAAPRADIRSVQKTGPVLYLKTNLWFGIKAGGSVGHIAGVVNALHEQGLPVTFASAEPPVMVDPGVQVRKIAPPRTFGLPYELNNYRFQRSFAREATRIVSGQRFFLIYQRLSVANYLGVVLSRAFSLPLVVEYNGSEVWVAKHWGRPLRFHALAAMAEAAMLRHAHLVVTISEVLRDELIAQGVEPERIVYYPNCIDPRIFSTERFSVAQRNALRARYGIKSKATMIAFIGTFGQWHGAEVLAAAIASLHADHREWLAQHDVHFLLVGDGLKMPQVRATIQDTGAGAICTLAGLVPQDQAALHLAAADILVSPHVPNADGTRFFGSPTKLFEYMAMEKGILASDLDQIGKVLSPGLSASALPVTPSDQGSQQLAVLSRPGDVEDLIRGLKFLVERQDWRAQLGRNARMRALASYTWAHHVEAILAGVREVLPLEQPPHAS